MLFVGKVGFICVVAGSIKLLRPAQVASQPHHNMITLIMKIASGNEVLQPESIGGAVGEGEDQENSDLAAKARRVSSLRSLEEG